MSRMQDVEQLFEALQERFFGKYPGVVVDNADPENRGRLKVNVPDVMTDQGIWAQACVPYAGDGVGFYAVPPTGATVWVEFQAGDPSHPIWVGCQWAQGQTDSSENVPGKMVLRTGSCSLVIDEDAGTITIEASDGSKIVIGNGGIALEGSEINMSANGSQLTLSASGLDALNGAFTVT